MNRAISLLPCLLVFSFVAEAQTYTKKVTVIFNDGKEIVLNDWHFFYVPPRQQSIETIERERNITLPPSIRDEIKKRQKKEKQLLDEALLETSKSSNSLLLSLTPLNTHGVTLGNIELTEAQLISIKFSWDKPNYGEMRLKSVNVLSTDGKNIELPYLSLPSPYVGLNLTGKTTLNGFVGNFSAKLDERSVRSNSAYIVEIKFQ